MKINQQILKLNKTISLSLLAASIVIMSSSSVFASSLPIYVQNKLVNVGANTPYLSNTNQTMIPIRAVCEALGLNVSWQDNNVILSGKNVLTNKTFSVKGNPITKNLVANGATIKNCIQIKNDRTYIPLRTLAELFGYNVNWNNGKISIISPQGSTAPAKPATPTTPVKPETPKVPTAPVKPETPKVPTAPAKPEAPVAPTTPTKPSSPTTPEVPSQTSNSVALYEDKVLDLVNVERQKAGLSALKMDEALRNVARTKSADMQAKKYFDHNSPTYGSPFDMMKTFGISYRSAGENIAMGQRTPEEVVTAWMNSPGHRANILNNSFTHIGVGYVSNGNYWTQMFIGK